jgi:hypothetical protein
MGRLVGRDPNRERSQAYVPRSREKTEIENDFQRKCKKAKLDTESSERGCLECGTCSSPAPLWDRTYTDLNSLCYNSFTGQGQLLWVGVCLQHSFGRRFNLVSMVSINLGIWSYGVETGDTGESIEPEESQ